MKALIDKFFSDNYYFLIEVSKKKISYFKRDVCAESLVANAYLYLVEKADIQEEREIPIWAINYINTELSFFNSQTIRKESVNVGDDKSPDIESETDILTLVSDKMYIEGFVNKLDRLEQIIWEVYAEKGMRSAGELAEHFNIDRTSAWLYKKELLRKLKKYVETEERI
jgi:hypothetical protein